MKQEDLSKTKHSMSIVSIAKCTRYDNLSEVTAAIRKTLELLGNLHDLFQAGKRKVLLKPNLLDHTKGPESAVNTHPSILWALSDVLKSDYNCTVCIGESSGGLSYGKTKKAFENMGLVKLAENMNVELIDFDRCEIETVEDSRMKSLRSLSIPKILREVDCIINVPKLKTHDLLDYTGAIKNMFGIIPGSGKRDVHVHAPRREQMAECIVDVYQTVIPHLAIMDAIIGMEGNGPAAGNPKKVGLILGSQDNVALDAVASYIVGFEPLEILTTRAASDRNLGIARLDNIKIIGVSLEDARIYDYKKTERYNFARLKFLPDFVVRLLWGGQTAGRPFIIRQKCEACHSCLKSCPVDAITDEGGVLTVDHEKCIECYCCRELCPCSAVGVRFPFIVRCTDFLVKVASKFLRLKGPFSFETRK